MKKYLEDSYCLNFESILQAVNSYDDTLASIQLATTYFYPEGGGQPGDRGTIDGIDILDVQISDTKPPIIHHLISFADQDKAIELLNKPVNCKVDQKRRLALMQQHSGQHLLSAAAEKLYNANTIGFHMGADYVTIDLDQRLTAKQVEAMETLANEKIYENLEIIAHYPSSETLSQMPLRKQPKVTENIRVIEISTFDFSPCGGTHLKTTAEIGIIKVKKIENYKQGIRIEFGCGLFALNMMRYRNGIINDLTAILSVPDVEIVAFIKQTLEGIKQDKRVISSLTHQLLEREVKEIMLDTEETEGIKVIRLDEENVSMNDLRTKVQIICQSPDFVVLARSVEGDKCHVVLAKSKEASEELAAVKMNDLFKTYGAEIGLKGGGNPNMAQGGTASDQDTDGFFDKLEEAVNAILAG